MKGLSLGAIELLRRKNNLPKFNLDKFPYVQKDIEPNTIVSTSTIQQVADLLANGNVIFMVSREWRSRSPCSWKS